MRKGTEIAYVAHLLAVASLALAAHSAVDFDWTYPSLMAMSAVLAATALAWSPGDAVPAAASAYRVRLFSGVLVVAALALALLWGAR